MHEVNRREEKINFQQELNGKKINYLDLKYGKMTQYLNSIYLERKQTQI